MNENRSSRTLVHRALAGLDVPRPVVGPLAVHFCARLAGFSLREYTLSARVLADSVIRYYDEFRPDAVWLSADTWVTAEAMGAKVAFTDDDQPLGGTGEPLVRHASEIDRIPPADPYSQGRMPLMLEALRRIRKTLAERAFVVACFDQYPFSLACALMGVETLFLKLVDDPPMIDALMERCLEYGLAYARALATENPDMLSGGDSPAGLIGPHRYREAALPLERRLIAGLHSTTDVPVSLHICGDSGAISSDMASSGADVLEIDYQVDVRETCRAVGPGVALWGNLDPVGVLAQGSEQEVRDSALSLIESVADCGHRRFVLSSGCTLAVETPAANLQAMFDAARSP